MEVAAARAYDAVANYFKGSKARLNFPQSLNTLPSFPANATIEEICQLARDWSVDAVTKSSGAFSAGDEDLGLVDEEIKNNSLVTIIEDSSVVPPITATVLLSPGQIESLREMPLYSPLHLSSWDWDFELHGTHSDPPPGI